MTDVPTKGALAAYHRIRREACGSLIMSLFEVHECRRLEMRSGRWFCLCGAWVCRLASFAQAIDGLIRHTQKTAAG
jgi:hypothetical protein